MSTDEKVTKDLLETLEDGNDGYTKGAEKLDGLSQPSLVATFREFANQRRRFADELQGMAKSYGDDPDRSGSIVAAVHRGWMTLRDALTKDDAKAVLEVAQQGDEHAIKEYEKALDDDISADLRAVVSRQLSEIRTAHASLKALTPS
ncbi:MAG: PA2169 family four-helix-bundle protein [Actinomycetota bacterium]|nr:PA2169 family four-helix-bundle protein [Actinomycetota bacterium]